MGLWRINQSNTHLRFCWASTGCATISKTTFRLAGQKVGQKEGQRKNGRKEGRKERTGHARARITDIAVAHSHVSMKSCSAECIQHAQQDKRRTFRQGGVLLLASAFRQTVQVECGQGGSRIVHGFRRRIQYGSGRRRREVGRKSK